jgi:hypothetical protein
VKGTPVELVVPLAMTHLQRAPSSLARSSASLQREVGDGAIPFILMAAFCDDQDLFDCFANAEALRTMKTPLR